MDNKLQDTIYYLVSKLQELHPQYQGKKKLAKLLYFIDFYYYKENGKAIATERYKAFEMGPVPESFMSTLDLMAFNSLISVKKQKLRNNRLGKEYEYETYSINKEKDLSLSDDEIKFIDEIFNKFKNKGGKDLEILSHNQAPWNSVGANENIPISTAYLLEDLDTI